MAEDLIQKWKQTRLSSEKMCAPLNFEQCRIQPCTEVSPPWWSLAHTSWFFARNVLQEFGETPTEQDRLFDYVLNSYYSLLGPRMARNKRGLITRPTMEEVYAYRKSVDKRVMALAKKLGPKQRDHFLKLLEIGIQHEQQHQELFYTEIKYILYQNPPALRVPYLNKKKLPARKAVKEQFISVKGGLHSFGNLEGGWGWDNEYPVHKYYLEDFQLQNRLVTNREYLEFMQDGGYSRQILWLDNGWTHVEENHWKAPLYWEEEDGKWRVWTLRGMEDLNLDEPVCHVSFYEAEAYATWKEKRLPTEREWEHAARQMPSCEGNFLECGALHPQPAGSKKPFTQLFGEVWQWTQSYFEPYPGYKPFEACLQEYNEKFMDNQRILRGGSCVSEKNHLRISYRNFWTPETRFQFTGFRLASF